MAYLIDSSLSCPAEVRRVFQQQLALARSHLSGDGPDLNHSVHQARRAIRRIRALLELLRPTLTESYEAIREPFRNASHVLSTARDAQSMVDAMDRYMGANAEEGARQPVGALRQGLLKHRERVTRRLGPRFEKALSALDKGDAAAPRWLESATHDDLRAGLTKSYRRARKAFQRVSTRPSIEGFHRLRRRSRDLALQLELFGAGLPGKPTGAKDRFDAIGHRLGREREVMLLLNYLRRPSSAAGVARSALLRLKRDLGAERARLRDKALASSAKALRRKKRKFAALLSLT